MGGLGNQLFQIFATIAYSIVSKNHFKFLNVDKLGSGDTTVRYTYWNTFLKRLTPFLINNNDLPQFNVIREKNFRYNNIDKYELTNKNIVLYGYFQSYKYFQNHYDMICRIIGLEALKQNVAHKNNFSKEEFERTISMHFRLGDYKKLTNIHPIAPYTFYDKCLEYMESKLVEKSYTILYFCEEEDVEEVSKTIDKLKQKFTNFEFQRGENTLEDWEQLLLMSCCQHNIIANSSFSWWGAYFNSNPNKIVCYPSVWFGPSANIDTSDLCPVEWIKITV
jgi:hypothetical protein